MSNRVARYTTFKFLPLLCGFIVFISTVIVAMTTLTLSPIRTLAGYVTVVNHGNSQTPVLVVANQSQRITLEIVGPEVKELLIQPNHTFNFNGHLTGASSPYGPQFFVISTLSLPS